MTANVNAAGFRRTTGDATGKQLAILLPTDYRVLHVASAADAETDWNVANPTHPTLYVHSETTPATDYVSVDHDGTDGTIDVRGGNLKLAVAGTDVLTVAATGQTIPDDILLGLGTGDTAQLIWETADANANELLLQLPAGGATDVPVLVIGDTIVNDDLGLFNGVVSTTVAIMGSTATATGPSLNFRKSRGTNSAPTVVTSGDDMGSIDFYGAVAADEYVRGARILAEMTGTIATTRGPGVLTFQTATDAAPSVLTTALSISAAQVSTFSGDVVIANGFGVILGHTAQIAAGGVTSELQVHGTAPADSTALLAAWSADAVPPRLYFAKSRSATVGTFSIITSGDNLGEILAFGDDGVDFNSNANASAAIIFDSTGTIAADRIPGRIVFQTATDAAPSVLTTSLAVEADGEIVINRGNLTLGAPATKTGTLRFVGTTSGTVTMNVADAAGTWTMQLPAAVGGAGQQLTDAAGNGVTSWAAASLGEWKNDLGILDPEEALRAVVSAPTHIFTYNKDVMPEGQSDGNGFVFTGIFAEEAPWAMYGERDGYRSGIAFSEVNAFGYARAAIQALAEKVARLEREQN